MKNRDAKIGMPFATLIKAEEHSSLPRPWKVILRIENYRYFSKKVNIFLTPLDKIKGNSTRIDGGSDLILLYCIRKKRKKESIAISFP